MARKCDIWPRARDVNADRSHIAEFAEGRYYIGVGAIGKQGRAAAKLRKSFLRRGTGEMGPPNSELWPTAFGRKWGEIANYGASSYTVTYGCCANLDIAYILKPRG